MLEAECARCGRAVLCVPRGRASVCAPCRRRLELREGKVYANWQATPVEHAALCVEHAARHARRVDVWLLPRGPCLYVLARAVLWQQFGIFAGLLEGGPHRPAEATTPATATGMPPTGGEREGAQPISGPAPLRSRTTPPTWDGPTARPGAWRRPYARPLTERRPRLWLGVS